MPSLFASLIVVLGAAAWAPPLEHLGRFDDARAIPEASGIVKSRRFPGIFWVHNDSGNAPLLFAVRSDGRIVRRFRLAIPNLDWEDIAIDDQGHLYLGDIGNNTGLLRTRVIYRIDEPDPSSPEDPDRPLAAAATVSYALPSTNRFDAECLFHDRKIGHPDRQVSGRPRGRTVRGADGIPVALARPAGPGRDPPDGPAPRLQGARHRRQPERGRHAIGSVFVRGDTHLPTGRIAALATPGRGPIRVAADRGDHLGRAGPDPGRRGGSRPLSPRRGDLAGRGTSRVRPGRASRDAGAPKTK